MLNYCNSEGQYNFYLFERLHYFPNEGNCLLLDIR